MPTPAEPKAGRVRIPSSATCGKRLRFKGLWMRKHDWGGPREIHGVATKLSLTLCVLRMLTDGVLEGLDDRYPIR